MTRPDLLALTPDGLAALANRGLVKRATKELDAGAGPAVEVAADGTVHGKFADGVASSLPPGTPLDAAACSCGALGVCRHRIALVLAYQRAVENPVTEVPPWSPGSVTDEELVARFGQRLVQQARRTLRSGYSATVRRPTAADPVATAELPTCTVRFLVPGDLGYVHTDVEAARRDEAIVLAVWAFREADAAGVTKLDVGGGAVEAGDLSSLEDLLAQLLTDGAAHAGPVLDAAWRRVQRDLSARHMHWPAAAVEDLLDQLGAYRKRSARYRAERFAELVTELHARSRATGPRSEVLGTDEPAETPLRRVRLTALGCRVNGVPDERTADVYFASGDMVLVHRDAPMRTATRTAAANVVSESVSRSASRVLRLRAGRVAQTSVTPVGTAWQELPDSLLVRDLAACAEELNALRPRVVRARVAAELVRVVEVAELRAIGYDPAAQTLEAVVADAAGGTAVVSATYRGVCPQSLDALVEALRSSPTHISGTLRRTRGTIVIDPLAVLTPSGVVVPDLATASAAGLPSSMSTPDRITSTLDSALLVLAEAAHRGLRDVPPSLRSRLTEIAEDMHRIGLRTPSRLLKDFIGDPAPATWLAAHLRVLITSEART
ncbi:hypothetical protein KIPE111705_30590 [Kibdelosporangium persicum]|uniref:SWIM zinc finger protein n=1 Tax=Kibdelosporangium persicum TaxID=2698649 RepID=A0ABX2F0X9_9PSEU|nr:hypothetical protein [Kibdelosporangium persicum]NRN64973.1 SWIM zinc finger protein [Kibdelosporangium persicum]